MKSIRILLCLSACLLIPPNFAFAQGVGASGTITGTVNDSSGAVVTNAIVTATDPQRGTKRATATDSAGRYEITGLAPTTYDVSAQHDGFQTTIQKRSNSFQQSNRATWRLFSDCWARLQTSHRPELSILAARKDR